MKKTVRIYFSGLVQGIYFRAFVKENAEKLDIKGFIRNLEDGRVEAFFEGQTANVEKLIELCKKGPKHAKIEKTNIIEEKYQGLKDFKILHI